MKTIEDIREEGLDKFYTLPLIAKKCLSHISSFYKWEEWDLIIEPSAGNGSFLIQIPTDKKLGIDISPDHKDIIKQDFLTYSPPSNTGKILVVGNPPFGRVSSLAIKFFNHASKWSDVIAFIIPRTFRRISIHNKLNTNFHLVFDEEIPGGSFSPSMMVKCCFQIWEKRDEKRLIVKLPTTHKDWDFLGFGPIDIKGQPTPPQGADFVIRAYGGKCGEIFDVGLDHLRPKSWHWIKSKINKDILMDRFNNLDYSLSLDTARQNSIGRGELVKLYTSVHAHKYVDIDSAILESDDDDDGSMPALDTLCISKNISTIKRLKDHLALVKIDHKKRIMNLETLKDAHVYCILYNISAQQYGPMLETFIQTKNKANECNGDCSKDGENIEIKVSLGGTTHIKFNFVQIRPHHDCDPYILTAYHLSDANVESEGELYIFRVSKAEIKKLLVLYGGYSHGTKTEHGIITIESLDDETNCNEYSLRPTVGDACWNALHEFRITEHIL